MAGWLESRGFAGGFLRRFPCNDPSERIALSTQIAHGRRLVPRIAMVEVGLTLLVAGGFAFVGLSSALAALVGGLLVVIGTLLFGWR